MVKTNLKLVAQKYKVAFEFPYQINSRWRSLKHRAIKNMVYLVQRGGQSGNESGRGRSGRRKTNRRRGDEYDVIVRTSFLRRIGYEFDAELSAQWNRGMDDSLLVKPTAWPGNDFLSSMDGRCMLKIADKQIQNNLQIKGCELRQRRALSFTRQNVTLSSFLW